MYSSRNLLCISYVNFKTTVLLLAVPIYSLTHYLHVMSSLTCIRSALFAAAVTSFPSGFDNKIKIKVDTF